MSMELIELGQQALASVSSSVAGGAPLVKCQLLASEFYEGLRQELKKPSRSPNRSALVAAARQCHQIVIASTSPSAMLSDLQRAIDLLNVESPTCELHDPVRTSRPVLRVIKADFPKTRLPASPFSALGAPLLGCTVALRGYLALF
jgi:hypothetical protein